MTLLKKIGPIFFQNSFQKTSQASNQVLSLKFYPVNIFVYSQTRFAHPHKEIVIWVEMQLEGHFGYFVLRCMQFGQQSIIGDGRINATGGRSYLLDNRRCSLVDLTVSRHARRESAQHQQQVIQQDCSNNNAGPSVAQRRPQTKLLGKCPD